MKINIYKTFKEIKDKEDIQSKYKIRCKCGHIMVLVGKDRKMCRWCGHWVYKSPQIEFRYKLTDKLKKEANEKRI